MSSITQTILRLDITNKKLDYEEFTPPPDNLLVLIGVVALSILFWPVTAFASVFCIPLAIGDYFDTVFKDRELKVLLTDQDPNQLNEYKKSILKENKTAQYNQILLILKLHSSLKKSGITFESVIDFDIENLKDKSQLKLFVSNLINSDLSSLKSDDDSLTKEIDQLKKTQLSLKCLNAEAQALNSDQAVDSNQKAILINIATISYVKNKLEQKDKKQWIIRPFLWLLPWGFALSLILFTSQDKSLFENNVDFLSDLDTLRDYKDLIDAHNDLVTKHNYLIPYLKA